MAITCKVCDSGSLILRKKHRMSGPVVAIGYIFLVPSILGILISLLTFVRISDTAGHSSDAAVGIAGGIVVFFGIASFVGGLVGWLLVMKKRVLECSRCGATLNAS
jgi:hypothetical protein